MARNRRSPSKTFTIIGAAAISAALVLTGCAPASPGGDDSTLTIAINGEPQSLDPAKNGADFQQIVQWLAYEPLIRMNSDGTFSPALAESWGYVGDDNTVFEITLRDDIQFADGTDVTVDDVVASIEYFFATPSLMHSTIDNLQSVEAVDDRAVRVTYSAPTPILPYVFSQAAQYGSVISAAGLEDPEQLGVATFGAGAYTLDPDATVSGDRYTFVKSENYWNPDAQHYDEVVVRVIGDPQTALSALRTGQIDVNTVTTPVQVPEAESAGIEILSGMPTSVMVWLTDRVGTVNPAMADPRVRQALNYAIDREAISTALGELYEPLTQIIPDGGVGHADELADAYAYDPELAQSLLEEAGYPDGFELSFASNTDNRGAEVAQILVEQWAAIGVTANLTVYNNQPGEMFGAIANGEVAALAFAFTPSVVVHQSLFTTQSVVNPFGTSSPEVDAAYAELGLAGEDEIGAVAEELSVLFSEDAWWVPVAQVDTFVFARGVGNLGGLGANGARVLDILNWAPAAQ